VGGGKVSFYSSLSFLFSLRGREGKDAMIGVRGLDELRRSWEEGGREGGKDGGMKEVVRRNEERCSFG